jgi:hypothetical protein
MGEIYNIDIFYIQLMRSVNEWYDRNYMNVDNIKAIHLDTVNINYEPERFKKTTNLHDERKRFLAEIHELVWETLAFSY